jgi:hypothetical protein
MWKGVAVFCFFFVLVIVTLIWMQPSSQESALTALTASEQVLDQIKSSDTAAKLDEARALLGGLKLSAKEQSALNNAIADIDQARLAIGADNAGLVSYTAQIKTLLGQAKSNLAALTAIERARAVKEQILVLVWPVVIGILVLYTLNSKKSIEALTRLGSLISSVKIPGGLELNFQTAAAIKTTQEEVLKSYRRQVIGQYSSVDAKYQISSTVSRIIEDKIKPFFDSQSLNPDFRCTIHVRDILFENSLYQLIDYLPRKWTTLGKGGRGRAWSIRFGMMGRCWRLEQTEYQGSVPTDQIKLMTDWGMTKAEAETSSRSQTLFCHMIFANNKSPLASFYLDAENKDAFGDKAKMDALEGTVAAAITEYHLDDALQKVWGDLQPTAPFIEIYSERK